MGDPACVFEAIARPCPPHSFDLWPENVDTQHALVVRTRSAFGLDWRFVNDCGVEDHRHLQVTPDQSARFRHATVLTLPADPAASFQGKLSTFFSSSSSDDLSMPGQFLCPYCAAAIHYNLCTWTVRPWTEDNAPDRIFFKASEQVFRGDQDQPMAITPTIFLGASYSLVGVSYPVGPGGRVRNHFVSQIRLRGRWHLYDCLNGGILTSSDSFDTEWHASSPYMLVYIKSSLYIATPAMYQRTDQSGNSSRTNGSDLDSPSGMGTSFDTGLEELREPLSPSGRVD